MKLTKTTPTLWTELTDAQSESINGGYRRGYRYYTPPSVAVAYTSAYAYASGPGAYATASSTASAGNNSGVFSA